MKKIKNKINKFETIRIEELEKKLHFTNSLHKMMVGILILTVLLYAYLTITEDYEINIATITITICLMGGIISNHNELKVIKNELSKRKNEQSS